MLAAILMVVAYNMGEWREIPDLLKLTKSDIFVWLVTFALTVFADLTVAVEAGMILAALLYIQQSDKYDHCIAASRRIMSRTTARTSCKTNTFPITPLYFGFTGRFCSARPIRSWKSNRRSIRCRRWLCCVCAT